MLLCLSAQADPEMYIFSAQLFYEKRATVATLQWVISVLTIAEYLVHELSPDYIGASG